jgi:hypothetical protein
MRWNVVHVDPVRRFSLDIEEKSGRTFVSIPVYLLNGVVSYDEWYEVDGQDFERYRSDPALAFDLVARCKRRELDHLLLIPPGRVRGDP